MRIANCAAPPSSRLGGNARGIALRSILTLIAAAIASVVALIGNVGDAGFITPARGQPAALSKEQSAALAAYDKALDDFKAILATRRAQITMGQRLPNLPGQALYLARTNSDEHV